MEPYTKRRPTSVLLLPSLSVSLVKSTGGRSTPLPTPCDACQKAISEYPFIAKHSTYGHNRAYHVACSLRIGLVSSEMSND